MRRHNGGTNEAQEDEAAEDDVGVVGELLLGGPAQDAHNHPQKEGRLGERGPDGLRHFREQAQDVAQTMRRLPAVDVVLLDVEGVGLGLDARQARADNQLEVALAQNGAVLGQQTGGQGVGAEERRRHLPRCARNLLEDQRPHQLRCDWSKTRIGGGSNGARIISCACVNASACTG